MSRAAVGNYPGYMCNVPEKRENGAHNVCKTLHAWKAHLASPGIALSARKHTTLTVFNINKMLTYRYTTLRMSLAHRLQHKSVNQHGHYTCGSRKLGRCCPNGFFAGRLDVLGERAKQHLRFEQDALPRRDSLQGMRRPKHAPSVHIRTGGSCGAGSSGKTI